MISLWDSLKVSPSIWKCRFYCYFGGNHIKPGSSSKCFKSNKSILCEKKLDTFDNANAKNDSLKIDKSHIRLWIKSNFWIVSYRIKENWSDVAATMCRAMDEGVISKNSPMEMFDFNYFLLKINFLLRPFKTSA